MLAKRTTRNRITLPKAMVSRFPGTEYFDVREEGGQLFLKPIAKPGAAS